MRLSQADLSSLLDVSRAAVSQATARGHKCGGYPISAWAVYDGAGRVAGYDVPDHIVRQRMPEEPEAVPEGTSAHSPDGGTVSADLAGAASGIVSEERIREILRTELRRENPAAERNREDYLRPASAGGLSYVMAKAVDGDSGTARAAVLSAASLFGGLIGHEVSDHWAGALVGAVLVGGLGWQAMQSGAPAASAAPATETPTPDSSASPTDSAAGDGLTGPVRAVGT